MCMYWCSDVMNTSMVHKQIIGMLYNMITIYCIYDFCYFIFFYCKTLADYFPDGGTVSSPIVLPFLILCFFSFQALLCGGRNILGTGMLLMRDQNEILWLSLQHLLETGLTCTLGYITPCLNGSILSFLRMPPTSLRQESFPPVNHYQNSMKL